MKFFGFKKLSIFLGLSLLIVSGSRSYGDMNVNRISGKDRYETAVKVNQNYINRANGDAAIITSGNVFKESLYASQLASALKSPYYVISNNLNNSVKSELSRLNIKNVYIVGGYNLISKDVDKYFRNRGIKINRLYNGKYLYGMSSDISSQVDDLIFETFHHGDNKGDIGLCIPVNDSKFPDLLSAIPLTSRLAREDKNLLTGLKGTFINEPFSFVGGFQFIIGGYNSVPSNIGTLEGEKIGLYKNIDADYTFYSGRIAGNDRYKTSVAIAETYNTMFNKVKKVFIVNGENYPDALSSGLAASINNGVVLLSQKDKLNIDTKNFIAGNGITDIIIIGGKNSISKKVENELKNITPIKSYNRVLPYNEIVRQNDEFVDTGDDYYDKIIAEKKVIDLYTTTKIDIDSLLPKESEQYDLDGFVDKLSPRMQKILDSQVKDFYN